MSTLKSSKQRDAVLANLQSRYDHPTAEDVFLSVKEVIPSISLATVYRNLKLLESEELGSFLYMKRHGATTIWENWNARSSHNHPMFGAPVRYLYTYFLGMKPCDAGWQKLKIAPQMPKGLDRISGALETVRGRVSVSLCRVDGGIVCVAELPEGCEAEFVMGENRQVLTAGKNTLHI